MWRRLRRLREGRILKRSRSDARRYKVVLELNASQGHCLKIEPDPREGAMPRGLDDYRGVPRIIQAKKRVGEEGPEEMAQGDPCEDVRGKVLVRLEPRPGRESAQRAETDLRCRRRRARPLKRFDVPRCERRIERSLRGVRRREAPAAAVGPRAVRAVLEKSDGLAREKSRTRLRP